MSPSFKASTLCGLLAMLLAGCSILPLPPPPSPRPVTNHAVVPETSKELDIPHYNEFSDKSGKPFFYYTTAKQREKQLHLTQPELTQDDILLRVWWTLPHNLTQPGILFEFVKNNGEWSGRELKYKVKFDPWQNFEEISNVKTREFIPTPGWDAFENLLTQCEISTLTTCDWVEDYNFWISQLIQTTPPRTLSATPFHVFSVEYATPQKYRFYAYFCADLLQDKIREAELFCTFLDALDKLDSTRPK